MKNIKRHWVLFLLLSLLNGWLLYGWLSDAAKMDEVGKQWARIVIPCMMLILSGLITGIYFLIRFIVIKLIEWKRRR